MEWLSQGWGGGLLAGGGLLCLGGLSLFAVAINTEHCDAMDTVKGLPPGTTRNKRLAVAALFPFAALLLARDVATTSSRCDLLMDQLNSARIKHGSEHHIRISWLTTSLKEMVCAYAPTLSMCKLLGLQSTW